MGLRPAAPRVAPDRPRLTAARPLDGTQLADTAPAAGERSGGGIWDRERYVGGLCDGSVRYTRLEPVTDIEVLCSGDLAVVRYRSVIDLTTPGGGGHQEPWHLDTYVREPGGPWRCRWSQATDTIVD